MITARLRITEIGTDEHGAVFVRLEGNAAEVQRIAEADLLFVDLDVSVAAVEQPQEPASEFNWDLSFVGSI